MFSLSLWLGNKPVFILLLFTCSFVSAQNLVPNGDFEFYTQCPDFQFQTNRAFPWYDPNNNSSDYYNSCAGTSNDVGVPLNFFGYQEAHSGSGYCGFAGSCGPIGDCAEYIATPLITPLKAGKTYCLSLWIANSDSSCWINNGIGAYLNEDSITFSTGQIHNISPQVVFTDIVSDTNWKYLESSFIANGGEFYLLLSNVAGNNFDTTVLCNNQAWSFSYYYVDDVSLVDCSYLLDEFEVPNIFTPNQDNVNDVWNLSTVGNVKVSIVNRWGNIVFEQEGNKISWDGQDQTEGVYYYKIETKNTVKTGFIQLMR